MNFGFRIGKQKNSEPQTLNSELLTLTAAGEDARSTFLRELSQEAANVFNGGTASVPSH